MKNKEEILSNILWIFAAMCSVLAILLPEGSMITFMLAWVSVVFCLIAFVNETAILLTVK